MSLTGFEDEPFFVGIGFSLASACVRWGCSFAAPCPLRAPTRKGQIDAAEGEAAEQELPTRGEFDALLGVADDLRGMKDLLRTYYATGARTHELIAAKVRDYQPMTRQLLLVSHKRSKTLKDPTSRRIALNAEAEAIIARLCEGRSPDEFIFVRPCGKPWTRHILSERFRIVRVRAGVRKSITIYSFRHLWISEMLMAGVDVLLVVRMAGTSVAMVEKVYGHFGSQSYQEAQARLDAARGR